MQKSSLNADIDMFIPRDLSVLDFVCEIGLSAIRVKSVYYTNPGNARSSLESHLTANR